MLEVILYLQNVLYTVVKDEGVLIGGVAELLCCYFFSQINLVKEAIVSQYLYDFDTRK